MKNIISSSEAIEKRQSSNSLSLKYDSDVFMQSICHWTPPTPSFKTLRTTPNSSLRYACIAENRLFHGLRHEGELMLLTPQNWEEVLKYGKPDILIMESIKETVTGHWKMGQFKSSPERDELIRIIKLAHRLNIPTVFWFTKGHEYHEHYKDFSRYFEYIFCADPKEADILHTEGLKAEMLLPCVQPISYNPYRFSHNYSDLCLDILYDGWGDLDYNQDQLNILSKIKDHGLSIIDSQNILFNSQIDSLPEFTKNILGCVNNSSRIDTLRYSKLCISFDQSRLSHTERNWMAVETAACHVPQIHHGKVNEDDVCKGYIIERPTEMDFMIEIARLKEDEMYRNRIAQLAWRNVLHHHTYSNRLKTICERIQIKHDWNEYPLISMIIGTNKNLCAHKILANLDIQKYQNKELIIVLNENDHITNKELLDNRDNVQLHTVSNDLPSDEYMNFGINFAEGTYCFQIDNEYNYGPNYILDMILHTRSIDMDFFGKPLSYHIQPDKKTNESQENQPKSIPLSIIPLSHSGFDPHHFFTKNSISGKTDLFRQFNHENDVNSPPNSTIFLNEDIEKIVIAIVDNFNIITEQESDKFSHSMSTSKPKLQDWSSSRHFYLDDLMI